MDIYYLTQYSSAHSHGFSLDPSRWFQRGVHGPSSTTANHRYLVWEEIKQCTEWRRISLWPQCICFKCVTRTGSPPFLLHRVAGPLFISPVYTRALIWLLCKKKQVGVFFFQKINLSMDWRISPRYTQRACKSDCDTQAGAHRTLSEPHQVPAYRRQHQSLPWGLCPSH